MEIDNNELIKRWKIKQPDVYPVFDTLDRLMREGYTIRIAPLSQTFYIANKKGGQVMSGNSFRDLCVNIVLAGL